MHTSSGKVANGIGQPVRRKEDFRLLTGRGRFGDDIVLPRQTQTGFVRSPYAHARIVAVDKTATLAAPGVLAVLTGADYAAAGLGPIPHNPGLSAPPDVQARTRGFPPIATTHFPLPIGKARYVGEPVAIIVAESIAAAKDAAALQARQQYLTTLAEQRCAPGYRPPPPPGSGPYVPQAYAPPQQGYAPPPRQ